MRDAGAHPGIQIRLARADHDEVVLRVARDLRALEADGIVERTGEAVPVDEKAVPFFKAGKELRERVNRGKPMASSAADRAIA